jgi:hypothetical protein
MMNKSLQSRLGGLECDQYAGFGGNPSGVGHTLEVAAIDHMEDSHILEVIVVAVDKRPVVKGNFATMVQHR